MLTMRSTKRYVIMSRNKKAFNHATFYQHSTAFLIDLKLNWDARMTLWHVKCVIWMTFLIWVASGVLYCNFLHHNLQSLLIIFAYWTQLLEKQNSVLIEEKTQHSFCISALSSIWTWDLSLSLLYYEYSE